MAYSAESMSRAGQRSGFSASNAVRRGSPSGRVLPGRSAPSQLELVPQRRLAGKPRAEAAAEALRFVKSSGAAPEQRVQRFESSQSRFVQRKGFAGKERAEPAGACPTAAFRRETACRNSGRGRAGALGSSRAAEQTILRSVESSGAAPEQRVQRFESGQARLVQRGSFAGKERAEPAGACSAAAFRRKAACRNSGRTTSSVL